MYEKRKRISLNCDEMPDEVYDILNEKALRRKITPYIIEIVRKTIDDKSLIDKLDAIEAKIDSITSGNIIFNANNTEEEKLLEEGRVVNASKVISKIDDEDKIECDY